MAIFVETDAVFSGFKTGVKKDSQEQWMALQFTAPELFKGNLIQPSMLNQSNILIFPKEGDYSNLNVGEQYHLELGVSARKNSSYPSFDLVKLSSLSTSKV